jgi:hypothetical protein
MAKLHRLTVHTSTKSITLLKFAFATMALHARALPALACLLCSALWAKKVAWMKRSCQCQLRRLLRSLGLVSLDSSMQKPGKACAWRMRKLYCLATPVSNLFKRMPAERKAFMTPCGGRVEYAKNGSRQMRKSRNSWQGQRDRGLLSCVPYQLIQSFNDWTRNQGSCAVQPRYRCHSFACLKICGS